MIYLPLLLMGMVNHITHRISSLYGGAGGFKGLVVLFGFVSSSFSKASIFIRATQCSYSPQVAIVNYFL